MGENDNKNQIPDLSILNKNHENKWVAISNDYKKVLAVGDKLADVVKDKVPGQIVFKVLPRLGYVPFVI